VASGTTEMVGERVSGAWDARVDAALHRAAERVPRSPFLTKRADGRATQTALVDWTGLPLRAVSTLGRADALAVLDWRGWARGPRPLQEEYLEWRVVRGGDGVVERVDLTCELPEFWRVLAAHDPDEALRLVAAFANEEEAAVEQVFEGVDPFGPGVGPEEREAAFAATMLDQPSPYNDGERAICCMVHRSNTLEAVAGLVAGAAFAFVREGGRVGEGRVPAHVVIPGLADAAVDGRGSDPLVVERLGQLACEGRLVTVGHPVALAIVGVEHGRLRRSDGWPAGAAWWRLERPAGPGRFRRAVLAAPPGERLRVGDLVDAATEEPIGFGGQVADLVQVAFELRVSAPGAVGVEPRTCEPSDGGRPGAVGTDVRGIWQAFTGEAAA